MALKEGIVPPLMDTNALEIEGWPPLTSRLKESKEPEFDDSMETMLVVHRSENGSICCNLTDHIRLPIIHTKTYISINQR